jgi:thymidylate synthase (FAD)
LEQVLSGAPIRVLDHGYLRYVAHLGDDLTPLEAARMSTGNPTGVDPTKDAATRDFLWRHAHATPFEMAVLQIEVQAPIFVAREWMRHRAQSYNEYSQRYSEAIDLYYVPDTDRVAGASSTNKQGSGDSLSPEFQERFREQVQTDQDLLRQHYRGYLDDGVARELARVNMPVSNFTRFRAQANLRNWLHFLQLRLAHNAQYEIRMYAQSISTIVRMLWPETWEVFEEHTLEGASLSRTERKALQRLLKELSQQADQELLQQALDNDLMPELTGSKRREFLEKIGWSMKSRKTTEQK